MVKLTIEFDIEEGKIKGMLLKKPVMTEKEYREQLTEEARLWKYFEDFLGYDLTSRRIREVI